ncbi:hypothetical protein CLPUN_30560 [Clostridium puniceum]|uniref:Uncharacterized protein n=1 Tax=Clostridium puniceum TaxID=29367 RepID=A0A1S8TDW6_9CLOT|nr:hypothetical protein [Clostridium puniceum]OOM75822.1 hypothetical protein CLPUN_30560 [Clostridium puniceum]
MKLNNSKIKLIILILVCIIILVMPILAININFIKNIVLSLLKNKANSYQYLQFSGIFLGIIVAAIGVFIAIEDKEGKEKNYRMKI